MTDMQILLDRFDQLAAKYGPDVVDAALFAARMEATQAVVVGLIGIAMLCASYWLFKKIRDMEDNCGGLLYFAPAILVLVGGLMATLSLLDPWTWTTLIEPKYWVAKKAFGI